MAQQLPGGKVARYGIVLLRCLSLCAERLSRNLMPEDGVIRDKKRGHKDRSRVFKNRGAVRRPNNPVQKNLLYIYRYRNCFSVDRCGKFSLSALTCGQMPALVYKYSLRAAALIYYGLLQIGVFDIELLLP